MLVLDDINMMSPHWARGGGKSIWYANQHTLNFRTCKKTSPDRLTTEQYNWIIDNSESLTIYVSRTDKTNLRIWTEYANAKLESKRGLTKTKTWMIYDFSYEYDSEEVLGNIRPSSVCQMKHNDIEAIYKQTIRNKTLNELL
jgi:hypothetical protein